MTSSGSPSRREIAKALDLPGKPVGGRQRLHVELAGGVLHPCRSHGEGLQLRIVGGGGHLGPQPPHVLDDGDGQGRALHRVRAGPQLVKQHQAVPIRLF